MFKKIFIAFFMILFVSGACVSGGIYMFQQFISTPANLTLHKQAAEFYNKNSDSGKDITSSKLTVKHIKETNSQESVSLHEKKANSQESVDLHEKEINVQESVDSHEEDNLFIIKPGESLQHMAKRLEERGLITNRHLFRLLAMVRGNAKKIQAGEYKISSTETPEVILKKFVEGKVHLHRITIPEGLTVKEIAEIVEKAGFGNRADFIRQASDPLFIARIGIFINENKDKLSLSMEGYLFPDTYFFPAGATHKEIMATMISRFKEIFKPAWFERCKKLGFSPHEIVILASIIEKETGADHERPIISSVFHNRLKRNMRLQSDPTVIYGIPDFNGNITRKDLKKATPYNTYAISGLPAGPIANPGEHSIKAALFPDKSDFIYFVSKNDKTHHFSKTLRAHNRAVKKYQLGNL
ncbi:Putative aminodeoxychorismate lyase (modular protein) [Desulfamplus magnetovallimortis]|uniref:Endolytic murein transglycosylase n=1 Tax=Desulfamplus magnetovallimortis TaxID=1246637 RepID=A0A1W1H612_9BACT|nr:endolytic transglycosylase MltG [Desulfamplus magnetovallimortis]SLM27919.1 Putative aminodeoxychorismate lyase (modular protein) [Desulfamplus magnetovallimortis]